MRKINKIIIHCSATREGQAIDLETIRDWHVKERGWSDIGYHYLVHIDGTISQGRLHSVAGAHTKGENQESLGICYIGGVELDGKTPKDTRTCSQADSLEALLYSLKAMYPGAKVHGHRDFSTKACPSFDATKEFEDISNLFNPENEKNC